MKIFKIQIIIIIIIIRFCYYNFTHILMVQTSTTSQTGVSAIGAYALCSNKQGPGVTLDQRRRYLKGMSGISSFCPYWD
jgi:hypothetical protein